MKPVDMIDRVQGVLIAILAFFAPLLGSQVSIRPLPLPAGGILEGVLGGAELPQLAQAILGGLACCIVGLSFARNRVVQLPHWRILFPLVSFVGLLGASVIFSQFKYESTQAWLQWVAYAAAFVAAIAAGGRQRNVFWAISGLTLSCAILGAKAVVEYGQMRGIDPNWRVFGGWINPNALAGMLIIAFPLAIALMISHTRLLRLVFGAAAFLMGCGVVLTQSLGGLLCFTASLVVVAFLSARTLRWKTHGAALVPIVCILIFAASLKFTGSAGGGLSRVGAISTNQEQSQGFRKLLWQSAWQLIKTEPEGSGVGTFRYVSTKPGLVTSTQLAHQSYLQIGAEGGLLVLVLFLAFLSQAVYEVARRPKRMPEESASFIRAGITGGLLASLAHSLIDSDFYYFGIGLSFFLLLGIGQQLAIDGSVPESISKNARIGIASLSAAAALGLLYFGIIELKKAQLLTALAEGNPAEITTRLASLETLAPQDPDVPYFQAAYSPQATNVEFVIPQLKRSFELAPKISSARALATAMRTKGNTAGALDILKGALAWDQNNLLTLKLQVEIFAESDQMTEAKLTAQKMVEVEGKAYFKIRSIPEIIPTQTYWARLFLAKLEKDKPLARKLLLPAIDGYKAFADLTIPRNISFTRAGMSESGSRSEPSLLDAEEAISLMEKSEPTSDEIEKIESAKLAIAKAREKLANAQQ